MLASCLLYLIKKAVRVRYNIPLGPTRGSRGVDMCSALLKIMGICDISIRARNMDVQSCTHLGSHLSRTSSLSLLAGRVHVSEDEGISLRSPSIQPAATSSVTERVHTTLPNHPKFKCSLAHIVHRTRLTTPLSFESTKQMQQLDLTSDSSIDDGRSLSRPEVFFL